MNLSQLNKFLIIISFLTFFSCEEIIMEKDISKSEVVLVAPVNNAQFYSTGVTFTWDPVTDATEYQLQIATPNFANAQQIILDTKIDKSTFTQQLPIGNYEWRVRAVNSGYSTNYSSRLISIVSEANFENNTVILNTPANNLITKTTAQNLSWQSIIGATGYQVQIYDNNNTVVSDQTVTATSLNYSFSEGNFSWKVRATNGTKETLYTSRSVLVDTTAPNTAILSAPTNSSTTTNTNINFQWNRTAISGSTEKDSLFIYTDAALTTLKIKKEASSPSSTTLDLGTYYWYVKSYDEAGNSSAKSSVFSFTIN